jgi:glycine betaine/proline transport system ATP-binding protein
LTTKIAVRNVSKVFGGAPDEALALLREGRSKEDILKETGQTVGVQDVNFDVEQGEIFVVMGLSGSGKSTLIRMLNRLIPVTAGSIEIDGEDIVTMPDEQLREVRLRKMAMVFQHFALFPHRTVAENAEYGLKVQGVEAGERRERALKALRQVGLEAWADRRPSALSGGMQQRVGLARGLAVDPEILLMDEPFSALDPLIRRDMQGELLELQRELHKTIVFITHDLLEALVLGDRIAIMKEGRFVQVGTAEEIVGNPADDYVAAFTQDIDRSRVFSVDRVLEPAEAVEAADATVADALARMDTLGRDALHLVEGGKPVGIVTYRRLADAARGGEAPALRDLAEPEMPEAGRGTPLYRLFRRAAQGLPIAVRDQDGTLAGVALPETIFDALDPGQGAREDEPAAAAAAE